MRETRESVISRFNSKVESSIRSYTVYKNYTILSQSLTSSYSYDDDIGLNIFMSIIYIKEEKKMLDNKSKCSTCGDNITPCKICSLIKCSCHYTCKMCKNKNIINIDENNNITN